VTVHPPFAAPPTPFHATHHPDALHAERLTGPFLCLAPDRPGQCHLHDRPSHCRPRDKPTQDRARDEPCPPTSGHATGPRFTFRACPSDRPSQDGARDKQSQFHPGDKPSQAVPLDKPTRAVAPRVERPALATTRQATDQWYPCAPSPATCHSLPCDEPFHGAGQSTDRPAAMHPTSQAGPEPAEE
jgi:hypothetical protein